jgi:hypothetical protein
MEGVMGWLDANEYFTIVTLVRERVDGLLSSTELSIERSVAADERGVPEFAHFCDVRGCSLGHLPV